MRRIILASLWMLATISVASAQANPNGPNYGPPTPTAPTTVQSLPKATTIGTSDIIILTHQKQLNPPLYQTQQMSIGQLAANMLGVGTAGQVGVFINPGSVIGGQGPFASGTPILGNGVLGLQAGAKSGNTNTLATTSGALTSGDCPVFDASGNLIDSGSTNCGGAVTNVGRFQFLPAGGGMIDPNTKPFTVRGTAMFDYLLCSFEFRGYNSGTGVPTNQIYRQVVPYANNVPFANGPGSSPPYSQPTFGASTVYVNHANVLAQLQEARRRGINTIRVCVEPAVQFANKPYVDPNNSQTYPSDQTILQDIVSTATSLGMVTELTNGNDEANGASAATVEAPFLVWLSGLFANNPYVWINGANEINSANYPTSASTSVTNPFLYFGSGGQKATALAEWISNETAYVNALRSAGWVNPIILDPLFFSSDLGDLYSSVSTTAPFNTDTNLGYGIHVYAQLTASGGSCAAFDTEANWQQTALLSTGNANFVEYMNLENMMIEETGINNNVGGDLGAGGAVCVYDPELGTSANLTTWQHMQTWFTDFLTWAQNNTTGNGKLFGSIPLRWWFWSANQFDPNTQHLGTTNNNGVLTTPGLLAQEYIWSPLIKPLLAPVNSQSTFGPFNFRNRLYNANFAQGIINQRAFAGGTLAAGSYGYDGWLVPSGSPTTTFTVSGGVAALNSGGFIRQVMETPLIAGQQVTVSVGNLTGSNVAVFLGNSSNPSANELIIAPCHGQCFNTFFMPNNSTTTGNVYLTIQAGGGTAVTFSSVQVEIGTAPTPIEQRPQSVELHMAQRYAATLQGTMSTSLTVFSPSYYLPVPMAGTISITNVVLNAGTGGAFTANGSQSIFQSNANSSASGFSLLATSSIN